MSGPVLSGPWQGMGRTISVDSVTTLGRESGSCTRHTSRHHGSMSNGERRLILAIVERAMDDAAGKGIPKGHQPGINLAARRRAHHWLTTDYDGQGSVIWWCRLPGLDPEPIREAIARRLDRDSVSPLNGRKLLKTKDLGEMGSLGTPSKRQDRVLPSDHTQSGVRAARQVSLWTLGEKSEYSESFTRC